MGEGLGVDDSWDPASQEQADKREGEKRAIEGRVRRERERERGRQAHRLHNARLGPVLMCSLFLHVFFFFNLNCVGQDLMFGCGAAICLHFVFSVQRILVLSQPLRRN